MSMPTGEWVKFEELCATIPPVGPGASWIRADFHFHTPASEDHKYGSSSYEQIAEKIAVSRLDAVFVTDHNEWKGIGPLTSAVARLGVKTRIYPGAELSVMAAAARIGDGLTKEDRKIKPYFFHCLALLPPSDSVENQIHALVTNGLNNPEVLQAKNTERKLVQSLEEVAETVRNWGGALLPAHFHQGKPPDKSRSFDDIYCDEFAIEQLHGCFDAIEIRDASQAAFFDGDQKGSNGQLIPEKGCVLGSDSHSLDAIGSEATHLLVEENEFEDIKTSICYRERVRFQETKAGKDVVLDLIVEGVFLGPCHFVFSDGLTALIGTKGAGKTSVLECLRFALGVAPSGDVDKYLNHVLGPAGRVWLSVRNRHGEKFLFVRARGDAVPRVFSESGEAMERDAVIPSNFPVEIRGWGEVTKLAEDKSAQLKLLDAFDPSAKARGFGARIADIRSQLPDQFAALKSTVDRLRATKTELDQLILKRSRLEKLKVAKITDDQAAKEKRDAELAAYRELSRVLEENKALPLRVLAVEAGEQFKSLKTGNDAGNLTAAEVAARVLAGIEQAAGVETTLIRQAGECLEELGRIAAQSILDLEAQFRPLEEAYQAKFSSLDPNEQDVLIARNEIVVEIARLPAVQTRFETLSGEFMERLKKYADLLQDLQFAVDSRSVARAEVLKTLTAKLSAAKVPTRLRVEANAVEKGNLPTGVPAVDAFGAISRSLRSMSVEQALRGYELDPIGGSRAEFGLEINDSPAIEFELYPGVWRPSEQLSAGQKSTAVLPLIIMLGEGPVILDQPEDNLDNKYIGLSVVHMMLAEKLRRQFVVSSHNATIVVMADSELVVEMMDKDGKAQIVASGFLNGPHSRIRQSVLEVLDGGETALRRRFSRYGIRTG
jgi:hypothetical protein